MFLKPKEKHLEGHFSKSTFFNLDKYIIVEVKTKQQYLLKWINFKQVRRGP